MDLFFECKVKKGAIPHADDDVATLQFIAQEDLRPEQFGLMSIRKAIQQLNDTKSLG
jgi:hypothetical protein